MIDKQKAINQYLRNVQQLDRLPFITDAEMRWLFGEDVLGLLEEISRYEEKMGLCRDCQKRCCPIAQCELYDTHFPSCPIFELRPVVCRLHFCHLFQKDCSPAVEALSDVFFACLNAGEAAGIPYARLFDSPPVARCAPEFIRNTETWMRQVKDGTIAPGTAAQIIFAEAEIYRTTTG